MKSVSKSKIIILLAVLLFIILTFVVYPKIRLYGQYCKENINISKVEIKQGELGVYFLDAGQADSTLICFPDGQHMLVDAGKSADSEHLTEMLCSLGIHKLDYLLLTHSHEDHIGGAEKIINEFSPATVILSDIKSDNIYYHNMTDAAVKCKCDIITVYSGYVVEMGDDTIIRILSPAREYYESENDASIVFRLTYKNSSFLFQGDAGTETENDILKIFGEEDIDSDIIKIGHHGSSGSSGNNYLSAVTPNISIISCGIDNEYHMPSSAALKRISEYSKTVLSTESYGNILIKTDGNDYEYFTGKIS